jgi:hypothetical protein
MASPTGDYARALSTWRAGRGHVHGAWQHGLGHAMWVRHGEGEDDLRGHVLVSVYHVVVDVIIGIVGFVVVVRWQHSQISGDLVEVIVDRHESLGRLLCVGHHEVVHLYAEFLEHNPERREVRHCFTDGGIEVGIH